MEKRKRPWRRFFGYFDVFSRQKEELPLKLLVLVDVLHQGSDQVIGITVPLKCTECELGFFLGKHSGQGLMEI